LNFHANKAYRPQSYNQITFQVTQGETPVNSEELEVSLKTDIESYINGVVAGMKQEAADLQSRIDAEFEKHRSQLNEAFQEYSSRLNSEADLDQGFRESIIEHLRLARDNGAQITAHAFAEAESMRQKETADRGFSDIRDAINDISCQTSQSAILKSLVRHAERFTSRGAFFIVRNEQFLGWQAFGKEVGTADNVIRHVSLPYSSKTILGDACNALKPVSSRADAKSENKLFLEPLGFERPESMLALPLIARGRGVAVLYVDSGTSGGPFNAEALETLLRVASLTVELLASNQAAQIQSINAPVRSAEPQAAEQSEVSETEFQDHADERVEEAEAADEVEQVESSWSSQEQSVYDAQPAGAEYEVEHSAVQEVAEDLHTAAVTQTYEIPPEVIEYTAEAASDSAATKVSSEPEVERFDTNESEPATFDSYEPVEESKPVTAKSDFAFETSSGDSFEAPPSVSFAPSVPAVETVVNGNGNGHGVATVDTVATVEAVPVAVSNGAPKTGSYRKRSIELPIEVSEDERADHVKARRFARLLVSEINLYNEQRVKEGRESGDLYDRLREAIDRSREMYQQRVQDPVASKFDYFHYELVNGLAEGDESRLGTTYPGSNV
jgi:hypothetical protein